jgi:predicted O-linked N-acetylglucosamine transferase (SPINDLY family)
MTQNTLFAEAQHAHQQNQLRKAERLYKQVIEINPGHADAHHFLGLVYSGLGYAQRGIQSIERAAELQPNNPAFLTNLGESMRRAGDLQGAVESFRKAIQSAPDFSQAHYNLGNVLKDQGRLPDAIDHYRQAVHHQPNHAQAWYNLGNTLMAAGNFRSASQCLETAVDLRPDFAPALSNLGITYMELDEIQKAVNRYKRAVEIQPDFPEAHRNLGQALEKQGDLEGAKASFARVLALEPDNDLFRLHVETLCPMIMPSVEAIAAYRDQVWQALNKFKAVDFNLAKLDSANASPPSVITYHGEDDRALKEAWANLFADRIPREPIPPRESGAAIHVGFVVTHGHEGVFLKCMRGIINLLPEVAKIDRFKHSKAGPLRITMVCSQQAGAEILRQGITHPEIDFLTLSSDVFAAAELVRRARFDVLHYWEIGTDSMNYFLPFFRAAPVQCATWGWPITSGVPEVDFYLSCEHLEPQDAQSHYSEELVLFKQLPTYYFRPPVPDPLRPRAAFGLGARDNLYLCTQNLRKIHPEMDEIVGAILRKDPQGRMLFIQDGQPGVTDLLRKRLQGSIPDVSERIQFLARLPEGDYLNVVALADVLLDSLHYCGGANTSYDAFAAGTPMVTLPTGYHRGRYTAAAYRQMGVERLIADSPESYVNLAVRVATDAEFRAERRAEILEHNDILFEDGDAVVELADFFVRQFEA